MRFALRSAAAGAALLIGLAGCSTVRGLVDDALSAAMRTAASKAIAQAAESEGQPLKADPVCTGSVKSADKSGNLACTGETQAGLPVTASVVITNAGDVRTCSGEMTIKIGNEAPFHQKFADCGG
jgi:hypothetical protein